MKEKIMKVVEKDNDSFSELVLSLAIVQATNTVIGLIKLLIEDDSDKKEETEKKKIKKE